METMTINKKAIKLLKEEIKKRAEKQRFYKDQRKTDHNKLPREISPDEASWKHESGRDILHIMYTAYGEMRGKNHSEKQWDKSWQKDEFDKKVERMIDTFQRQGEEVKDEM